ncbi:glycoside hydrolase family 3 C-terminal domain-containing protein, partial [Candidatus Hydrogenedentota bacterium]
PLVVEKLVCLHGVARAGFATVFPQAIGMAATWNTDLIYRVATAISDEARAKHHEFVRQGDRGRYKGLTYWTPNINIFRDPRWGRGQETYGEDPFLTGRFGVAFVKGLQGEDPDYLKLVATPKHYAVHSGPEGLRHSFDAIATEKEMRETYLPAFKECVQEGKAVSIMPAYNRTNGEPCCASLTLLQDILRDEWGFDGYVVSDCGAVRDIHMHHKITELPHESAAMAVKNCCDLNCGKTYDTLMIAFDEGLVTEAEIDVAVTRLMEARIRLGMFDPPEMVPYTHIPIEVNECEAHRALALETAQESIVLLKNEDRLLPLDKGIRSIAVIGPTADSTEVLLGNYNGISEKLVTVLEGIKKKVESNTEVLFAEACDLNSGAFERFAEATAAASRADVAVMVMGLSPALEGEENDRGLAASDGDGDRLHVYLPGVQEDLLKAIHATGKPVVLVLTCGSAVAMPWVDENIPAIINVWYPGEEGGTAVANVLFGDYNPGGRLPVTFVKSMEQLPDFTDYSMEGRTYRFMKEDPLYEFGYGLSYTTFAYANLALSADSIGNDEDLTVTVDVENTGSRAGDEVVQIYLKDLEASTRVANLDLRGFKRISLGPGEKQTVTFTLTPRQMALITDDGKCVLEPGKFEMFVGGSLPGGVSEKRLGCSPLNATFEVVGDAREMTY